MPEGHSIRLLANTFEAQFLGQLCRVSSPQGRFDAGAALLDGLVMTQVLARGKHLFLAFGDEPLWLHVHLGLYGAWRFAGPRDFLATIGAPRVIDPDRALTVDDSGDETWEPKAPVGAVRCRILCDHGVGDLSGPTVCEVLTSAEVNTVLERLGPDPLINQSGDRERFIDAIRSSKRSVGIQLMDQKQVAGVGNIFRAEVLFRQRISPGTAGARLSRRRIGQLWDDLVYLMNRAVQSGHITTVDDTTRAIDEESEAWFVYRRAGKPCLVCGAPVRKEQRQGRDLFWCSTCQR